MSVQEHVNSESDSENLAEQGGNEDEEMSLPPCQFCQEQAPAPDDPSEGKNRATNRILWIFHSSMRRESGSCSCETSAIKGTEGARALIAPSRCFLPISCPSLPAKALMAELFWTLYVSL